MSPQPEPIGRDEPTLEEMAGQMVLAGFRGAVNLPKGLTDLLADRFLGGVVLFGRNIGDPRSARALTDSIRERTDPLLPPMIAVDQEGGRVQRFKAPFTRLPPARYLGLTGDAGLAYKWGKVVATELQEVGVNFNLAPVVDVDTNPDNPVIGDRSLSATAEVVARMGMSLALGMQQGGVGACAKHFPVMATPRSTVMKRCPS
jgi:beta-N-acetylhexosaminidase